MGKALRLGGYSNWTRGKCIGKGCFGTVSLAVDKSDGRVFAVKSVDRATCLPAQLGALEDEIRILRSLSSPCVVQYLGDDETREIISSPSTTSFRRNLHLEYLPGGTLADVAVRDEMTVRSLTRCLVSALKHVHDMGVVHCDVKGKNVLIGREPGQAKLADFGSAFVVSERVVGAPIMPRGSPLWMAPEVVRRERQGPESDVWSLGCTVIEMVAGKPAWEDRGAATLSRIGFSDEVPEFPAGLSESGRDFLEKCLRRDPARRWSCDRLLQHPFLAGARDTVAADSSPRCVLDWVNSEFDDEEDDRGYGSEGASEFDDVSAKQRIGELATSGGANWESDGWTVVRPWSDGESAGTAGVSSKELDSPGVEAEIAGTSSEYSDCWWAGLEYSKLAGSCCRYGLQKPEFLANRPGIMCCYSLYIGVLSSYSLLFLLLLLSSMNKLNYIVVSYTNFFYFRFYFLALQNITRDNYRLGENDYYPLFGKPISPIPFHSHFSFFSTFQILQTIPFHSIFFQLFFSTFQIPIQYL